jgi:hypothetical protein
MQQLGVMIRAYSSKLDVGRPGGRGPQTPYLDDYADLAGREELATRVFDLFRDLPHRAQRHIIDDLTALVGARGIAVAIERADTPEDALPEADAEKARREAAERELRMGHHEGAGCKAETQGFCERDHFPDVLDLDGEIGLLWLTRTHPHGRYADLVLQAVQWHLMNILHEANDPGLFDRISNRVNLRRDGEATCGLPWKRKSPSRAPSVRPYSNW